MQLTAEKRQTLQELTDNGYAQASFCLHTLLKDKEIKVNGKKVSRNIIVNAGDIVQYYLTEKQATKTAYSVVYSDENVCVVDKESGVNSEAVFAALQRENVGCRFIHRLDRNTCGLMIFAWTDEAERELLHAFKKRSVMKRYHALCLHAFPKSADTLTAYWKKDERRALVTVYSSPVAGSEKIITEYKVLAYEKGQSKAEITLHTGKTHQIRAHLAHIGCPIVGDMKYGDAAENKRLGVTRQRLVAKALSFTFCGELAYLNGKTFYSRFDTDTP